MRIIVYGTQARQIITSSHSYLLCISCAKHSGSIFVCLARITQLFLLLLKFSGNNAIPRTASTASRPARSVSGTSDRSGVSRGRVLQSFVATHTSRKKNGVDTANMPLFELAALTPKESQVNARKLRNFLELNGKALIFLHSVLLNLSTLVCFVESFASNHTWMLWWTTCCGFMYNIFCTRLHNLAAIKIPII